MTRVLACLALLVLLGGALAIAPPASGQGAPSTTEVVISNLAYSPRTIEIKAGDTVRWSNRDGTPHTATASGSWDTETIAANGGEKSVTIQQPGTYSYVCKFHASMTGTIRVISQNVENAAPTIAITNPPGGATVMGIATIAGTASDANGDPLTVNVRIDSGTWKPASLTSGAWTFPWDTRNLTNGVHTVTARANDGKITALSATLSFTVHNAPTIALLTPANNTTIPFGTLLSITGSASAAPGATLVVEVSIDGDGWRAVNGRTQWSYTWNTTNATIGSHTIQARASDGAAIILSAVRNVTVADIPPAPDNEPPALAILSPAEGATVAGLVNVTGNASDPDGPTPFVEVNVNGAGWRNATGRSNGSWWFQWIPEGTDPGPVVFEVRASDGAQTVTLVRRVALSDDAGPFEVSVPNETREGQEIRVVARAPAPASGPLAGARLFLAAADGTTIAERTTNATGVAIFPSARAGTYALRGYAPGAIATVPLEVKARYEVLASPMALQFTDVPAITIHVRSGAPVAGVPVQLRGEIVPGGETSTVTTARDGNASFFPQPLVAGELAVFVAGNDTGVRVRILPMILASWSPDPAAPEDDVVVKLTYNDRNASPAAGARVEIDAPGEPRHEAIANARGEVVVRSHAPGTLRLTTSADGIRASSHSIAIRTPPGAAELSDLVLRPGAGYLEIGAIVRNVGHGNGTFVVDAVATSGTRATMQRTYTTQTLVAGDEELAAFRMPIGPGEYQVVVSVRNSTATVSGTGIVLEDGLAEPIEPVYDLSQPTPRSAAKVPGFEIALALAAALAVALARRRRA